MILKVIHLLSGRDMTQVQVVEPEFLFIPSKCFPVNAQQQQWEEKVNKEEEENIGILLEWGKLITLIYEYYTF